MYRYHTNRHYISVQFVLFSRIHLGVGLFFRFSHIPISRGRRCSICDSYEENELKLLLIFVCRKRVCIFRGLYSHFAWLDRLCIYELYRNSRDGIIDPFVPFAILLPCQWIRIGKSFILCMSTNE